MMWRRDSDPTDPLAHWITFIVMTLPSLRLRFRVAFSYRPDGDLNGTHRTREKGAASCQAADNSTGRMSYPRSAML